MTSANSERRNPALTPDDPPIDTPLQGPIPITATPGDYEQLVAAFTHPGPLVGFDTERATGIRYANHAYLIQVKAESGPIGLLDPIALPDLSALGNACRNAIWVVHAGIEDLQPMAETGLVAKRIFDTQIAGKLLGYEHIGLGAMVEECLGVRLAKNHTRENWSLRPIKQSWLNYAALDVEYLPALANFLTNQLTERGRLAWAEEEFDYLLAHYAPTPPKEPWRRVKGSGSLKSARQLAVLRAVFDQRERQAQKLDMAPSRLLPNSDLIDLARRIPRSWNDIARRPWTRNPRWRKYAFRWWKEIKKVRDLEDSQLPPVKIEKPLAQIKSQAVWRRRAPQQARSFQEVQSLVNFRADELGIWAETLLSPRLRRALCANWKPGRPVAEILEKAQARHWQIELLADSLEKTLRRTA